MTQISPISSSPTTLAAAQQRFTQGHSKENRDSIVIAQPSNYIERLWQYIKKFINSLLDCLIPNRKKLREKEEELLSLKKFNINQLKSAHEHRVAPIITLDKHLKNEKLEYLEPYLISDPGTLTGQFARSLQKTNLNIREEREKIEATLNNLSKTKGHENLEKHHEVLLKDDAKYKQTVTDYPAITDIALTAHLLAEAYGYLIHLHWVENHPYAPKHIYKKCMFAPYTGSVKGEVHFARQLYSPFWGLCLPQSKN